MALLSIVTLGYQPAEGYKPDGPKQLYHQAWELVRDNYYDISFAGQNWAAWEHKYDSELRTSEDAQRCIKAMLESLKDPYTRYLNEQAFRDEKDAIDSHIVGIGINLIQRDNRLIVTRTIDNSPASNTGLLQYDEIIAIDSKPCIGFTPDQAAERIRGQAGSAVDITVRRKDSSEKTYHIVRAEIKLHAVSYKVIEPNIGYIQLSTFISNDAAKEFHDALEKLSRCDGLIIDMRDNPGGLLSNSLEIASMLLDGGVIVKTVGRGGPPTVTTAEGNAQTHQPIAVIVNEESASASEILAGALKDNGRAIIIGTHTYGKGLVQEINHLRDNRSAIHITVSKYLTPNGSDINKVGVLPDIQVLEKEQQDKVAVEYLKEKNIALHKPPRVANHL